MEEIEDFTRTFGAEARNLAKIGDGGPLDFLQGPEMMQQRTLTRGTDAGNFLQSRFTNVFLAQLAMRPERNASRE